MLAAMNRNHFTSSGVGRATPVRGGLDIEMRRCRRLAREFAGKPEESVLQNMVREYGKLVRQMDELKKR